MINSYFEESFKNEGSLTALLATYALILEDKKKAVSIGKKMYDGNAQYTTEEIIDIASFFKKVYPEEYNGTEGNIIDFLIDKLKTDISRETDSIVYFLQTLCICLKYRYVTSRFTLSV